MPDKKTAYLPWDFCQILTRLPSCTLVHLMQEGREELPWAGVTRSHVGVGSDHARARSIHEGKERKDIGCGVIADVREEERADIPLWEERAEIVMLVETHLTFSCGRVN